jgi:hypothetical protein
LKKPHKDPLNAEDYALENAELEPASMEIMYELIDKQVQLQEELEILNDKVKEVTAQLRNVSEKRIPDMAETLQLKKFESPDGLKVLIKEDVKASISNNPEAKAAAIEYLRKTGNQALVKQDFVIHVDDYEKTNEYRDLLLNTGFQFDEKLNVNTSSLKAFVRRELEAGNKDFDPKTFGVFQFRKTVIK